MTSGNSMSRALAVNHAGWNVEYLSTDGRGWVALAGPFKDREFTVGYCDGMQKTLPDTEFRVYEALKC